MKILKRAYLYFKWEFFDTIPYGVTFQAYLDKLEIDKARKQCGDIPLKDRIKDYWRAGNENKKR